MYNNNNNKANNTYRNNYDHKMEEKQHQFVSFQLYDSVSHDFDIQ